MNEIERTIANITFYMKDDDEYSVPEAECDELSLSADGAWWLIQKDNKITGAVCAEDVEAILKEYEDC